MRQVLTVKSSHAKSKIVEPAKNQISTSVTFAKKATTSTMLMERVKFAMTNVKNAVLI